MDRWEKETVRDKAKPLVVSIGCSHQLNARLQAAAIASGAHVREAPDVTSAAAFARELLPLAVVVPLSLLSTQRDSLEALVHAAIVKTSRRRVGFTKK